MSDIERRHATAITVHADRWGLVLSQELEHTVTELATLPNGPRKHALNALLTQAQVLRLGFLALGQGLGSVGITSAPTSAPATVEGGPPRTSHNGRFA